MGATTLPYTQDSFAGGMNLLALDTKIAPNQYKVGINIRSRFGYLKPVKAPVELEFSASPIKIQGLYAFGDILVCFADGLAYYRTSAAAAWTQIVGFLMDTSVDYIYACAVPESSLRYNRENAANTPTGTITLQNTTTAATPVALIVQDGINQPFLIFPDGTTRAAKTYALWDVADREYVPVGKQMVYFNGILFIVSTDGKKIYRSVSGRPLDFVVAINSAANKVADADVTSFAVDANEIKLLTQLNASSLLIITAYAAYSVVLDFDSLLYGEPTFSQTLLFTAGITNQFSFADILGDFAFIDKEGLRSFNAVLQLTYEGNNGVFSLSVAELFNGILQTNPCVGSFDNYTYFAVRTIYSANTILVYDNIQKVFVSLDILTPQPVKMFASTYTASRQRFFAATSRKVYELYSQDVEDYQDALLFTRAIDSRGSDFGPTKLLGQIKTVQVRSIFEEAEDDGQVQVTEIVDGRVQTNSYTRTIVAYTGGISYPVGAPAVAEFTNFVNNLSIPMKGKQGEKVAYIFLWTSGAKLTQIQTEMNSTESPTSLQQQSKLY